MLIPGRHPSVIPYRPGMYPEGFGAMTFEKGKGGKVFPTPVIKKPEYAHEGAIIANGQVYEAGPNEVPVMARNGEAIIPFSKMNKQGNGLTVNFNIDGNLIADEATFDKFVYKIDKKLNEINQRYYS